MTSDQVQAFFSVVLLGAGLWAAGVLVPAARRSGDRFAVVCAILAAVVALAAWLLIGTGVHSS
jgi:ABC-type transport system involved in cytochrome c biogenesis permease subunit